MSKNDQIKKMTEMLNSNEIHNANHYTSTLADYFKGKKIPENEEEIIKFLDNAILEE